MGRRARVARLGGEGYLVSVQGGTRGLWLLELLGVLTFPAQRNINPKLSRRAFHFPTHTPPIHTPTPTPTTQRPHPHSNAKNTPLPNPQRTLSRSRKRLSQRSWLLTKIRILPRSYLRRICSRGGWFRVGVGREATHSKG